MCEFLQWVRSHVALHAPNWRTEAAVPPRKSVFGPREKDGVIFDGGLASQESTGRDRGILYVGLSK